MLMFHDSPTLKSVRVQYKWCLNDSWELYKALFKQAWLILQEQTFWNLNYSNFWAGNVLNILN